MCGGQIRREHHPRTTFANCDTLRRNAHRHCAANLGRSLTVRLRQPKKEFSIEPCQLRRSVSQSAQAMCCLLGYRA